VLTKRLLTALMIVVIVATIIGLAGLFRAQMVEHRASTLRAENEVSAIRSLRAIGAAQARYRQRCTGYASLGELIRAGELPSVRLTGDTTTTADGYTITVDTTGAAIPATGLPPNCIGTRTDFFSHADPIAPGQTGTRYYASDSRQMIFHNSAPMTYPPPGRSQRPGS
jgi:hypothetical protein